jgi:hypothetical protein
MKLALIFIFALACNAMIPHKISHAQKDTLDKLKASGTWAGFFVKLAEVQVMTGSPVDELLDAINDALEDLATKRDKADDAFVKRTDEHNSEV